MDLFVDCPHFSVVAKRRLSILVYRSFDLWTVVYGNCSGSGGHFRMFEAFHGLCS